MCRYRAVALSCLSWWRHANCIINFNPSTAKLKNLNFHPLEVVRRYRDPQLQAGENYTYSFNLKRNIDKSAKFKRPFHSQ